MRELKCEHVSSSEAGDYFQVMFAESLDDECAYVLIQRQLEFPDEGKCYVETNDVDFCGHYVIHNAELTRNTLRFSYGKPSRDVRLSFEADNGTYIGAERVLRRMIPGLRVA